MPGLGLLHVQGGFSAIDSALSEVNRKDVRGIGISGQQHGFVPMDGDGKVNLDCGMSLCIGNVCDRLTQQYCSLDNPLKIAQR